MPSSTPSHAFKRQNRSITTFFPPSTPNSTPATTQSTSVAPPPLPDHLQASLISVGMRIRKSIAQGYKTKNTAFEPYLHSDLPSTTNPEVLDPFSTPPSSQESIPDNGVTGGNELKRGLPSCEEEEADQEDGNVEPPEQPRSAFDLLMANRHLAIPKSQKKRDARRRGYHAAVLRKEVLPVGGGEGVVQDDFGDAGFLRPVGEVCVMDVDE